MNRAYLVLSDGSVFEGERFGAHCDVAGDIAFCVDVVGYMKTISDPKFADQIVVQTFPLLGNYGSIEAEAQGDICVRGYVVRECCDHPSNFRSQGTMDDYFAEHGIAGIAGVDTRAIMKRIRNGRMRAYIVDELPGDISAFVQTGGDRNAAE